MSQTFSVALIGDDEDEGSGETFVANLSNATAATINTSQAVGTIIDDDETPVADAILGTAAAYSITEGDGLSVDAGDSTDGDSNSLVYRWDFGN